MCSMHAMRGRVQLVLEDELYKEVRSRAAKSGASLSLVLRDLVKKGLEIEEDVVLTQAAEARWRTFRKSRALSHESVKKRFGA